MKRIYIIAALLFISQVVKSQYNEGILIEQILKTDTTSIGQDIAYPIFEQEEITILKITIPQGVTTGWHKHEFPVFAYVLKGMLTVETEHNKIMQFSENTSFSEMINVFHNGVNIGKEDVVLIAFYMGGKGVKLSQGKN